MTTGHDIMVKLSGVPAGTMPPILADRIARVLDLHCLAYDGTCQECVEPWPCPTHRILAGEEEE